MKYVHTNIISKDWKTLAGFYIQVFNCKLLLPQRDLSGDWLSKATGVKEAQLKGAHLRLPGYGKKGPTLEIFEYSKMEDQANPLPNRKGFGHLAFEVDDVAKVLEQMLELGGKAYGEIATKTIDDLGTLTFVYAQDPEGNIIELQNWGMVLPKKEEPKTSKEPVVLPKTDDVVLTVDSDQEDVLPIPSTLTTADDDLENPISKRAFLDQLENDLEASKQDLDATKEVIKLSKEEAKYQVNKTKASLSYEEERALNIPKSKQELLAELKNEMQIEDKEAIDLPKVKTPEKKPSKPVVAKKTPKIELPPIPADLRVEFKKGQTVLTLDLTQLKLSMSSDKLAQNLWSFSNLTHPDNTSKTYLEQLGEAYRADLVPLKKHYKAEATDEDNEKAWALTPRLRDSLKHFLTKCAEGKNTLEELKLEQIHLSPQEWVETYENLLTLTLAVEAQGGTTLRLGYL